MTGYRAGGELLGPWLDVGPFSRWFESTSKSSLAYRQAGDHLMLHAVKKKVFEASQSAAEKTVDPDFELWRKRGEQIVTLTEKVNESVRALSDTVRNVCQANSTLNIEVGKVFKSIQEDGGVIDKDISNLLDQSKDLWASGLDVILENCLSNSVLLHLHEIKATMSMLQERFPERENLRVQFDYYSNKIRKLQASSKEMDEGRVERNNHKLEDAREMYFVTNETLKVKLMGCWMDRVLGFGSVLTDHWQAQQLFFSTLSTSFLFLDSDLPAMRTALESVRELDEETNHGTRAPKKSVFNRFKRNVLGVGQAVKTKDPDFDKLSRELGVLHTLCTDVTARTQAIDKLCRHLFDHSARASDLIYQLISEANGEAGFEKYIQISGTIRGASSEWAQLCFVFSAHLTTVLNQLRSLKLAIADHELQIADREEARSCLDYYNAKLAKLSETNGKPAEVEKTKTKMAASQKDYDQANDLTKKNLRKLLDTRPVVLGMVVGGVLQAQNLFFAGISESFKRVNQSVDEKLAADASHTLLSGDNHLRMASTSVFVAPAGTAPNSFTFLQSPTASPTSPLPSPRGSAAAASSVGVAAAGTAVSKPTGIGTATTTATATVSPKGSLVAQMAAKANAANSVSAVSSPAPKAAAAAKTTGAGAAVAATAASASLAPSSGRPTIKPPPPAKPAPGAASASAAPIAAASLAAPVAEGGTQEKPFASLKEIRSRYLESTQDVEKKAADAVSEMKANRAKGIFGISQEQTQQNKQMLEGLMTSKAKEKSRVDDALKMAMDVNNTEGMENEHGVKDPACFNLNNTGVFRTLDPKKAVEKYREICDAIIANVNLKEISLTNADVGDSFCVEFARVLKNAPHIIEVNLNSNPISAVGIKALCEGLKENTTLQNLKLHNLSATVDREGQQALLDTLKVNTGLIKLSYNFPQKQDNETKFKYLDRNAANWRKKRQQTAASTELTTAVNPNPTSPPSATEEPSKAPSLSRDDSTVSKDFDEMFAEEDWLSPTTLTKSTSKSPVKSVVEEVDGEEEDDRGKENKEATNRRPEEPQGGAMVHVKRAQVARRKPPTKKAFASTNKTINATNSATNTDSYIDSIDSHGDHKKDSTKDSTKDNTNSQGEHNNPPPASTLDVDDQDIDIL